MTLFDWLFKDPAALHRQTTAPLYNERLAFLTHMKERDRKYNTLRAMATHLLHINRTLGFSNEMRVLTMEALRGARNLVTKHRRRWNDIVSSEKQIGVTQPRSLHVDEDFASDRRSDVNVFKIKPMTERVQDQCFHIWARVCNNIDRCV